MTGQPGTSLKLPRNRRLKQRRDFTRVKNQGQRLARGCLAANWLSLPSRTVSRVGVITGRRLGNAVVRNRARRLLREAYRRHQHHLNTPLDLILIARSSIAGRTFREVESDLLAVLNRGRLLKTSS